MENKKEKHFTIINANFISIKHDKELNKIDDNQKKFILDNIKTDSRILNLSNDESLLVQIQYCENETIEDNSKNFIAKFIDSGAFEEKDENGNYIYQKQIDHINLIMSSMLNDLTKEQNNEIDN